MGATSRGNPRHYVPFGPKEAADFERLLRLVVHARYQAVIGGTGSWDGLATREARKAYADDVRLERQTLALKGDSLRAVDFTLADIEQAPAGKVLHVRMVERFVRRFEAMVPVEGEIRGMERHELELVKRRGGWQVAAHRHYGTNDQRLAGERARTASVPEKEEPEEDMIERQERRRAIKLMAIKGVLVLLLLAAAVVTGLWYFGPRHRETTFALQTARQHVRETWCGIVLEDRFLDDELSAWVAAQGISGGDESWYPYGGTERHFMGPPLEIQPAPQARRAQEALQKIRAISRQNKVRGAQYLRRYMDITTTVEKGSGDEQREARARQEALLRELGIR